MYNTSTLQSTKLLTKCTLHRIDELVYSNRADEFETLLPISRRDCSIYVSSRSYTWNFKKDIVSPVIFNYFYRIDDCSVEINVSNRDGSSPSSQRRGHLPSMKTDVTTRCRSKRQVDSSPSELINSADASPSRFLSARHLFPVPTAVSATSPLGYPPRHRLAELFSRENRDEPRKSVSVRARQSR